MLDSIHMIIGKDADTITWWQMVCRATLIFFYTLLLVRVGGRRIFGKRTSFDIVLGVILGSVMSRALTANAQFFPSVAAVTALVLLHMLLAKLAYRSRTLGYLIKGREVQLVDDGEVDREAMKRASMSERDLLEALRSSGNTTTTEGLRAVYLERSGEVSVIRK